MTIGDVIIRSDSVRVSGPLEVSRIQNPDNVLTVTAYSIELDHPDRRTSPGSTVGMRCALTHAIGDKLKINKQANYPGGTEVDGEFVANGKLVANGNVDINGQLRVNQGSLRVVNHDNLPSEDENENRRALLHGAADQLIVNYASEYTGGTEVAGNLVANGRVDVNGQLWVNQGSLRVINHDNLPSEYENDNRRAFLHGSGDQLVINYAGEYTGGTKVESNLNVNGDLEVAGQLAVNVFEWPAWPELEGKTLNEPEIEVGDPIDRNELDTAVGERMELIGEIRRMKQEILSLRAEIDSLTKSEATPEALEK